MTNETEKQEDVVEKYFYQDQRENERATEDIDNNSEETNSPSMRELLEGQTNNCRCTLAAPTIGLPKPMFTFRTEVTLVLISPFNAASQLYIPTTLARLLLYLFHRTY